MEWEFKMPPWDLTEPELNSDEANLSSVGGPSCSVDLKLGGLGDFGMADEWKQQSRALELPMEMSVTVAAGGALKRPKMLSGGGGQSVSCLVDGCRDDLSHCRVYHRRHKVCEVHSKTPMVLVGGQEQRFCQQCSRFHLLVEFDEVKRSCRKRLDGHNRRRRKPQPDPIYGTKFPICSQIFPIAATDSASSLQPYPLHFINRAAMPPPPPQHFGSTFTWTFKEGKQAPLDPAATISPAAASSSRRIIFTNEFPWHLDSDCALSLLSSSTHTRSISLGHGALVDRIPTGNQLMLANLEYGIGRAAPNSVSAAGVFGSGVESEHAGTVMVSDAIDADLHCRRGFHGDGEGASDRASQSLPFSWY